MACCDHRLNHEMLFPPAAASMGDGTFSAFSVTYQKRGRSFMMILSCRDSKEFPKYHLLFLSVGAYSKRAANMR